MTMKKDNGIEYVECGGCGMTFDPENSYEMADLETHDCDNYDSEEEE